jgi:5-methylcytosine-specific restriction endonuclease McrA
MKQLKLFQINDVPENAPNNNWWEQHQKKEPDVKTTKKYFRSKEEYYKSEEWEKIRIFALHRTQNRCQRCGAEKNLEVHHLTYDNLYNEKPQDLEVLCKKCHYRADRERESDNRYNNALDTYMSKKYGEDWDYFDGCEEEFDAWLERQQDDY